MTGISIIIVTYKPGKEIYSCIKSIKSMVKCPYEIIICDNSPELNFEIIRITQENPEIIVLSNPLNPGFGSANNSGAIVAIYDYLLFINPDAEIRSELNNPDRLFSKNTGIISGYCTDLQGNYKRTAGIFPTKPSILILFSRRLDSRPPLDTGNFSTPEAFVDYTEGSFYLMRADVFRQVGGFDENIFLYGEDYELSYRVFLAGYINKISRDIKYAHAGGFNHAREPYIVAGLIYFSEKHLGFSRALAVRLVLIIRTILLLLGHFVMGLVNHQRRKRVIPLLKSLMRTL